MDHPKLTNYSINLAKIGQLKIKSPRGWNPSCFLKSSSLDGNWPIETL